MLKAAWDDLVRYPIGAVAALAPFFEAFWSQAVAQQAAPVSVYATDAARLLVHSLVSLRCPSYHPRRSRHLFFPFDTPS